MHTCAEVLRARNEVMHTCAYVPMCLCAYVPKPMLDQTDAFMCVNAYARMRVCACARIRVCAYVMRQYVLYACAWRHARLRVHGHARCVIHIAYSISASLRLCACHAQVHARTCVHVPTYNTPGPLRARARARAIASASASVCACAHGHVRLLPVRAQLGLCASAGDDA